MNNQKQFEVIVPLTCTYTIYRKFTVSGETKEEAMDTLLPYEMANFPEIERNSDFGGLGKLEEVRAFHILDAKITEL